MTDDATTTDKPRRPRAANYSTEEIVVERVWCRQCGETRRSHLHRSGFKEQGDGSARCFIDCRTCGNRWKLIEEKSL